MEKICFCNQDGKGLKKQRNELREFFWGKCPTNVGSPDSDSDDDDSDFFRFRNFLNIFSLKQWIEMKIINIYRLGSTHQRLKSMLKFV